MQTVLVDVRDAVAHDVREASSCDAHIDGASDGAADVIDGESERTTIITTIHRLLERLHETPRPARNPDAAAAELVELAAVIDAAQLEFGLTSAEYAASDDYDSSGYCSPLHAIRDICKQPAAVAGAALTVGEQASRLPESVAALRERKIGFGHLALIASTREFAAEQHREDAIDEARLLRRATQQTVTRFRRTCMHARHAIDHEAFLRDHVDRVEERFLELRTRTDGCVWLRGFLDSVGGATLRTALDPLLVKNELPRERRLADALVEIAEHALDTKPMPEQAGQRPHVQVTVSLEALRGARGSDAAEMEFAGPVPAATAQRLACDGMISRVVLGPQSEVVDVGRAKRVPGPAARRALRARDGGCVWPGCDRPASWTEAHHVVHWAHDGATDLANLALVCKRHHWKLHEGGWQLPVTIPAPCGRSRHCLATRQWRDCPLRRRPEPPQSFAWAVPRRVHARLSRRAAPRGWPLATNPRTHAIPPHGARLSCETPTDPPHRGAGPFC